MEGRLPQRPLSPLWEEMNRMGCTLTRPDSNTLRCQGNLRPGEYTIHGGVSSQFITGLLFALSLLKDDSRIKITGTLESKPYVDMTLDAMEQFGVHISDYTIKGSQAYRTPGKIQVEGDWSNAAFLLAANALGSDIQIEGLNFESRQGDKAAFDLIPALSSKICISARDIPDLIPILSVIAAANKGAIFTDVSRLRLKESDRVASVIAMLKSLGGNADATENTLTVYPAEFQRGVVDAQNDHRIAMATAIAATAATGNVTILGAQCVAKSYPSFWEEYSRLGGNYEQHLR
jgi:3-phosphoshikimate 1-carboxyvinyltransferase